MNYEIPFTAKLRLIQDSCGKKTLDNLLSNVFSRGFNEEEGFYFDASNIPEESFAVAVEDESIKILLRNKIHYFSLEGNPISTKQASIISHCPPFLSRKMESSNNVKYVHSRNFYEEKIKIFRTCRKQVLKAARENTLCFEEDLSSFDQDRCESHLIELPALFNLNMYYPSLEDKGAAQLQFLVDAYSFGAEVISDFKIQEDNGFNVNGLLRTYSNTEQPFTLGWPVERKDYKII